MDLPTKIVLRVNERINLSLTGAGAVGYCWYVEIDGDQSTVIATVGPEQLPPLYASGEPYGGSASQALFLEAMKPGQVEIRLKLIRAHIPPPPPRESHHFVVVVEE